MNDEPDHAKQPNRSLDERFARRPHMRARLHLIADLVDQAIAEGCRADEAEDRAIPQIQKLGQELLRDWAQEKHQRSVAQAQMEYPNAVRHKKKSLSWFTTFGTVEVVEQLLRLGRRGAELRPFCQAAGLEHRSYSRRLQRVLTDFGSEVSFGRAARSVREHYGIEVPISAVRDHTLAHGRIIGCVSEEVPIHPAKQIITQMDGGMVPVMEPGKNEDKRKEKTLLWREVRLCSAHEVGREQPIYGATLGTADIAGWLWQETTRLAGGHDKSRIHGVGDGAPWIVDRFQENFRDQGSYLIDFYHVSEYLAAAAKAIVPEPKQRAWRRRQQGRLLNNQVEKVLRSMEKHQEPAGTKEAPVRAACRYLDERRDHLDYQGARKAELPIGSGEIESGHRHVVQQRLKLSGSWWREPNAQAMLNLRVVRANGWWDAYWSKARN